MSAPRHFPRLFALLLALACFCPLAIQAGELSREALEKTVAPPFFLGEPDPILPITPIFRGEGGEAKLAGYVFESIDLAPIAGFSGTPPNMLVTLDAEGRFLSVAVVSQQEPVFQHGIGPVPLDQFVAQYAGKSLARGVRVATPGEAAHRGGTDGPQTIDGVAKATASVRIINQSVLGAALEVAREKLGARGAGQPPALPRPIKEEMDFAALTEAGLVTELTVTEGDLAKLFAGTAVEGLAPEAEGDPEAPYARIRVAYLNIPTVGENLLGAEAWARMEGFLDGGHGLWVSVDGRAHPFDPPYVLGGTPEALTLTQDGLALEIKDFVPDRPLALDDAPDAPFTLLQVFALAGFDPARPWSLSLAVTRERGQIFPERVTRTLTLPVTLPERWFQRAEVTQVDTGWRSVWVDREGDLAILALGLVFLALLLGGQPATMRHPRLFALVRAGFLLYTLVVIGWLFQAQLSIVTLAGLVRAALTTGDLTYLLWDPPSLVLWAVVLVTALIWGRGTFCGWLCPYGALQDLIETLARPLRLRQFKPSLALDRALRWVKYALLAGFLGIAALWPAQAETAAEVEPFKTAITMVFDRSWPAVAWAVFPLLATLVLHKAFCRYLCPLGAAMALLGRLRRWDWIARRADCGAPCRLCERRCRYGAIDRSGAVNYAECFQCMDCVVIHQDPKTCVPRVLASKHGRTRP